MLEVHGSPPDWIARHGRPAAVTMAGSTKGMPAYESGETGALVVFENMLAFQQGRFRTLGQLAAADRDILFFPRSYQVTAARSVAENHELVALHEGEDAVWSWRPLVYSVGPTGLTRFGSQMELEWRWGLMEAVRYEADLADLIHQLAEKCVKEKVPFETFKVLAGELGADHMEKWTQVFEIGKANDRAAALLVEHLNPQQRLDYWASRQFYVRGTINKLYRIELGNGASIVHPDTRETQVSLCLHPERWMPEADVSLATKLLIEAGKAGEKQMLEGARPTRHPGRTRSRELERKAWELERELLPAQLAEVI